VTPGYVRTAALVTAMIVGALLPQLHAGAFAIRWLVMAMLFVVFLGTRMSRASVHQSHGVLFATNLAMGFASWAVGYAIGGNEVALAAFFAGITPTAAAAPVIVGFLRGRVDYVVAAFVLTNLGVSALFPALLPWMVGRPAPGVFAHVAGSVGLLVFVPLGVAIALRAVHPPAAQWPRRLGGVSFGMWLAALTLISANASHFVRAQADLPHATLARIAVVSLLVCVANFALGRLIGGREFGREASQALGQKNTTLTIYLAMAYASPLIALGPTCYVVWHNLWNSWQLHRHHATVRGRETAT